MSSTGATLSGSYSGASATPTAVGFKYGTDSGSLNHTISATDNNGSLSAILSNLTAGQTYYYKAFVTVSGTGDYSSTSQTFYGTEYSFTTKKVATASVTTNAATGVTSSSAVLNGQFSGASGAIYETGFYWGTEENSLTHQLQRDGMSGTSGSFAWTIGETEQLSPNTTYYFKAYVLEMDEASGNYVERLASTTLSFTTQAVSQTTTWEQYLSDYGMPDVSGIKTGLRQSGTYSDRDDKWYSVNTNNNKRQIAIHTYSTGAPGNAETLNYVVLYDEAKYAPVWTYHVMNSTYWPDNNVGRNENWMDDPAINLTQQGGLDNAGTIGYSRGHLVASDYRQTSVKQNKQTFYHSNQAPQWQNNFNSGVWSSLEERVKTVTPSGTTMLYVVTGVLYESSAYSTYSIPTSKPSGSLTVPIPTHFYKCIMKCTFSGDTITGAQGIAFVYSNCEHVTKNTGLTYYGTDANTGNEYFVTSIDAIEARAGFDFFAGVPDNLEASAESNTSHTWFTGASMPNNISSVGDVLWGTL